MFRLFRAVGYFFSGKFSAAWETLLGNQYVVAATYDEAINKKGQNALTLQAAVAGLLGTKQEKVQKVTKLTNEVGTLSQVKAGALAKAKTQAAKLAAVGKTTEEIKLDPEYIRCQAAYENAGKDLADKQAEITRLEGQIKEAEAKIAGHKAQLTRMKEEVKNLDAEKNDTVASIAAAKQEKAINDALNGITQDTTDADLAAVRKKRDKLINEATISSELSGTNPDTSRNEFLDYATRSTAASEFDALIGLETKPDTANLNPAKLPEK